jgi:hypothetical protein
MKMKHHNLALIIIFSITFFAISCDKIEPPYTTTGNNNVVTNDTIRKVLLEDFTGHTCINCPTAHKIAADLQLVYGKQLIIVGIHAGSFANPKAVPPYLADYRTTEGTTIFNFFGANSTPIGMVNRAKQTNGSYLIDKGAFGTQVSKLLDSLPELPEAYISLEPNFNNNDSTLSVVSNITFLSALPSGKYNICLMITESGIISAQKNIDAAVGLTPEILDYEHKHVLRGMPTPAFGDEILDGTPVINQTITKNYSQFKFGKSWVPANCHLVAFIYYADGPKINQIIQAQEVKIN